MEAAQRYVAWLERHARWIAVATMLAVAGSLYLIAFHLPLYADFSYLLPPDVPAVADLREIERRVGSKDTTIVVIRAPDATTRAAATAQMVAGLERLDKDLVEYLVTDDREARDYFRARRHLFVPLDTLIEARDTLARSITNAKLAANPLYVDLDDDPQARARQEAADQHRLDDLRAQRREAEARLDRSGHVSTDGRVAMILVKTTFNTADVERARRLLPAIEGVAGEVRRAHPEVAIGFAGGTPTAVAEHGALVAGMVLSSLVTGVLVILVLLLHLRSARLIAVIMVSIVAATIVAFGLTALTVGHLNAATAFLGAIIAGNGVNYGILLATRYREERKGDAASAMARAIAGTLRPTIVAALGAATAYGALVTTSFQGFADFAVIGSAGMVVCWIVAYSVLPLLVLRFAPSDPHRDSLFARAVGVFRVRRPAIAVAAGTACVIVALAISWRYVAADPFEYDMTQLRSEAPDAVAARDWMKVADTHFGRGIWTKTYVLTSRPEQVPDVLGKLEVIRRLPDGHATIGTVLSIADVVPPDQAARLAALAEIRTLLDAPGLDALDEPERRELWELRPPDDLRPVAIAELPVSLRRELQEIDGRIGNLILIAPTPGFEDYNGHDFLQLARAMELLRGTIDDDVRITGASMIFADLIETIQRDGVVVTVVAAIALAVIVVLVVGPNRRSVAVLAATFGGTVVMVATCALVGLRVNFLDFIALPITLGLGVDYAINVADRADRDDPDLALRMTGAAVLVCSLTTIIGYASLLLSDNLAIRGFGLASLIGEITTVIAALAVVPAIVSLGRRA